MSCCVCAAFLNRVDTSFPTSKSILEPHLNLILYSVSGATSGDLAAAAAAGRVWLYNYGLRGGRTIYQGSPLLPVLELVAFFPLSPVCRGVSPGVVLLLSALAAGRPFLAGVLLLRAFEGSGMGKLLVALSAAAACCL